MRSLLNFFYRNSSFFLFIGLQIIALLFIFNYNKFHRSSFINSSNRMVGWTMDVKSSVTDYFHLKKANEELAKENAFLKADRLEAYKELSLGTIQMQDTVYEQQYIFTPGKVINSSVNKGDNYLTLNIGSSAGVRKDMAVISPKGIVGHVTNVSSRYSTVLAVISSKFQTQVMTKKSHYFGLLKWNEGDRDPRYAYINDITRDAPLRKGEEIITRGSSKMFPKGIKVGYIEEVEVPEGEEFQNVKVKLSVDFYSIFHVYVITNKFKTEQLELENNTLGDGK